jgi:hypothetical protein
MDIEETRKLIDRGYPDALTVDPDDLARLRESDHLERVRPRDLIIVAFVLGLLKLLFVLAGCLWGPTC